jgi:hypothetical protein
MYPAASERRKAMILATSSAVPWRGRAAPAVASGGDGIESM